MSIFIRLTSLIAIFLLKGLLPETKYQTLFFSLLFAHYLLAVLYAKSQFKLITSDLPSLVTSAIFLPLTLVISFFTSPLINFVFGIHHAFNDTYLPSSVGRASKTIAPGLRALSTFLLYLMAIHDDLPFTIPPAALLFGLFPVTALLTTFVYIEIGRQASTSSERIEYRLYELIGITIVAGLIGAEVKVQFIDAVFYHLVEWVLIPIVLARGSWRSSLSFVSSILGTSCFFCLFTPSSGLFPHITFVELMNAMNYWGTFHVLSSFPLSRWNPHWIRRLFSPIGRTPIPLHSKLSNTV